MSCKKIFIAATGQHCGKTTLSLGLFYLARKYYKRVGFIKPVGQEYLPYQGIDVDKDVAMMAEVYGINEDIQYMSPVLARPGFTKDVVDGKVSITELEKKILEADEYLSSKCDFLIIEGTGHGGVGSIFGLSNARVAHLMNAPVIILTEGGIGSAFDKLNLNLALYEKEKADVRFFMLNKIIKDKRDDALHYIAKAAQPKNVQVLGGLNFTNILANPSLKDIGHLLGKRINGNQSDQDRIIQAFHIGAASTHRVIDLLTDATLLVIPSSRDELLITLSSLYQIDEYRQKIVGCVVTGKRSFSNITRRIVQDSRMPYIRVFQTVDIAFNAIHRHVTKLHASHGEKIAWIHRKIETMVDWKEIEKQLAKKPRSLTFN